MKKTVAAPAKQRMGPPKKLGDAPVCVSVRLTADQIAFLDSRPRSTRSRAIRSLIDTAMGE